MDRRGSSLAAHVPRLSGATQSSLPHHDPEHLDARAGSHLATWP